MTTNTQFDSSAISRKLAHSHPQAIELLSALVKSVVVEMHQKYTSIYSGHFNTERNITAIADDSLESLSMADDISIEFAFYTQTMRSLLDALHSTGVEVNVNGIPDEVVPEVILEKTPAQDIANELIKDCFEGIELSGDTIEVDVSLTAMTRQEFFETITVPVEARGDLLEKIVSSCSSRIDATEYLEDNEYWEDSAKFYEIDGARYDV